MNLKPRMFGVVDNNDGVCVVGGWWLVVGGSFVRSLVGGRTNGATNEQRTNNGAHQLATHTVRGNERPIAGALDTDCIHVKRGKVVTLRSCLLFADGLHSFRCMYDISFGFLSRFHGERAHERRGGRHAASKKGRTAWHGVDGMEWMAWSAIHCHCGCRRDLTMSF